MIDAKTRAAFVEAIRKTFSEMAFIDALPVAHPDAEPNLSHVIYLSFIEPDPGFAALFLPLECKKLIVENVYGEDWDKLQSDQIDDCLLELLNILVGHYLSEAYGAKVKRDIALPRLLFDATEIAEKDGQETFYFDAEGTLFRAVLEINYRD